MEEKIEKTPENAFNVDEFNYILSSPIGYKAPNVGQLMNTQTVTLVSPLVKFCIMSKGLCQMIMRATIQTMPIFQQLGQYSNAQEMVRIENQKAEEAEKAEEAGEDKKSQTPDELAREVEIPIMASEMNFELAMEKFKELAFSGCVLVEGTKINFIQWGQISEPDLVEMFYQFVGVFIMPSLFYSLKEEKK